jgi:hypothetical protein
MTDEVKEIEFAAGDGAKSAWGDYLIRQSPLVFALSK